MHMIRRVAADGDCQTLGAWRGRRVPPGCPTALWLFGWCPRTAKEKIGRSKIQFRNSEDATWHRWQFIKKKSCRIAPRKRCQLWWWHRHTLEQPDNLWAEENTRRKMRRFGHPDNSCESRALASKAKAYVWCEMQVEFVHAVHQGDESLHHVGANDHLKLMSLGCRKTRRVKHLHLFEDRAFAWSNKWTKGCMERWMGLSR